MSWAAAVAALGPVHWWRFEETSGSWIADSAGSAHGTVFGADLDVTLAPTLGSAIGFDGVDDWVNAGRLDLGTGDTEQSWVFVTDATGGAGGGGTGTVVGASDFETWGFFLSVRDGAVVLEDLSRDATSASDLIDGPTLVVVTVNWSTGVTSLYIDGTSVAIPNLGAGSTPPIGTLDVGIGDLYAEPFGMTLGNYLDGPLDELFVVDRILTAGEAAGLYAAYATEPNTPPTITAVTPDETINPVTLDVEVTDPDTDQNVTVQFQIEEINGSSAPTATGGDTIDEDGMRYHIFTESGNIIITDEEHTLEYLLIGGGGGGGSRSRAAGGGSGGDVIVGSWQPGSGSHLVTIGSGGSGGSSGSPSQGNDGGDTTFDGLTAEGGKGGGGAPTTSNPSAAHGKNGATGSGAGVILGGFGTFSAAGDAGTGTGGRDGGSTANFGGGGGAGAGGPGEDGVSGEGGDGGPGLEPVGWDGVIYPIPGAGGKGGTNSGGAGADGSTAGAGGDGASGTGQNPGGDGADGLAIIRYPLAIDLGAITDPQTSPLASTPFVLPLNLPEAEYQWRARAYDGINYSGWTTWRAFIIEPGVRNLYAGDDDLTLYIGDEPISLYAGDIPIYE